MLVKWFDDEREHSESAIWRPREVGATSPSNDPARCALTTGSRDPDEAAIAHAQCRPEVPDALGHIGMAFKGEDKIENRRRDLLAANRFSA